MINYLKNKAKLLEKYHVGIYSFMASLTGAILMAIAFLASLADDPTNISNSLEEIIQYNFFYGGLLLLYLGLFLGILGLVFQKQARKIITLFGVFIPIITVLSIAYL